MLNNEFPPLGGGTGTVNQALLQRMAQMPDLEIDLVTSAEGTEFAEQHFAERIHIYKLPVRRFDIHHASNRELLAYAARALSFAMRRQLARPYDLCMAWSAVPAGGTALALRRLTGLPYLVRVCGPDIPGFERRYRGLYPLLTPVIKAIWHGAETVVAKCAEEADLIHAVDSRIPVTLIPNGVDTASFRQNTRPQRNFPLRLLCVARLIERKGQKHLIEAVHLLSQAGVDVRLDLIGTGDAQPAYEEQVKQSGLEDKVRFLGYVPRQWIPDHYASADVFVLASYNEGMSVATLEAMAAGLPLVVTRTGGTADLVVEGVNGLTFNWGDIYALSSHLLALSNDRVLVRRMGVASRHRAGMFSWEAAAERYLGLFTNLASPNLLPEMENAA
jgi:glycosyltransferase involved in cell wall biosynthesis